MSSVRKFTLAAGLALLSGAIAPAAASAQVGAGIPLDSLRSTLRLQPIVGATSGPGLLADEGSRAAPGSSSGSPSAFGAAWGDVFAGVGYQNRARYTKQNDGNAVVGFGLGNQYSLVGAEIAISSASTFRRTPFSAGGASIKVYRVLPYTWGVAAGVENALSWGTTDAGRSVYGVVSKYLNLRDSPSSFLGTVAVNAGVGNHRFLSEKDFQQNKSGVNVFGSVGVRLGEYAGGIADWTGQDLTLAASIVPFAHVPFSFMVGVADVTRRAGDGPRFIAGGGFGFNLFATLASITGQ